MNIKILLNLPLKSSLFLTKVRNNNTIFLVLEIKTISYYHHNGLINFGQDSLYTMAGKSGAEEHSVLQIKNSSSYIVRTYLRKPEKPPTMSALLILATAYFLLNIYGFPINVHTK